MRRSTPSPTKDVSASEHSNRDPDEKPVLPYREGLTITALHHEPPEPFGIGYDTEMPPQLAGWENLSQVAYCLSRPPLEGRTNCTISKTLTITSTIRTGQHMGAQIVVVNRTMVAKIYDPLYYSALNECGYPEDVVIDADGDYCREAAAYAQLQKSPELAAVVPHFHGTWTMDVETPVKQSTHKRVKHIRAVRFILMELIVGDCMDQIDPYDLRESVRSTILKQALAAEALLYGAGVYHQDICPRNIIVVGSDYDDSEIPIHDIKVSVKIIDFNIAGVATHPRYSKRKYLGSSILRRAGWPDKLPSPIFFRHGHMMDFSTKGWCSNDDGEAEKWLREHFHGDDHYVPVVWSAQRPNKRPEYQKPAGEQYTLLAKLTAEAFADSDSDTGSGSQSGSESSEESNGKGERAAVMTVRPAVSPTKEED